jgi:chlorobactene glucosyltransferase
MFTDPRKADGVWQRDKSPDSQAQRWRQTKSKKHDCAVELGVPTVPPHLPVGYEKVFISAQQTDAYTAMSLWVVILAGCWFWLCVFKAFQLTFVLDCRRRQTIPKPLPTPVREEQHSPSVQFIIPARNEATCLPDCLNSVLAQQYPHFSVLVVDDRSTDATNAIAQQFAAKDDRVKVQKIEELPEGWQGKSHAMWQAAQHGETAWLLFVDADVTLDPWALQGAMTESRRTGVELLSIWPRMICPSFWQEVIMPLCALQLAQWFSPQSINRRQSPIGYVNGQFVLIQRETYLRIDGHRAVRDCIVEDANFGRYAKERGVPMRMAMGTELGSVRMFASNRAMFRGWVRIFSGSLCSPWKAALSVLFLLLSAWPLIAAPLLVALLLGGHVASSEGSDKLLTAVDWSVLCFLCLVHVILFNLVNWHVSAISRLSRRWLWFYPLSIAGVIAILSYAGYLLAIGRTVTWRGTRYQVNQRGSIVSAQ